ncbi:MAG: hypothetical protein GY703_09610 [Gammaproteobacteria bacterium]|nr:hypothetical protein [Gammaproteobacteria bacterium]
MKLVSYRIVGESALLMHSDKFCDPLSAASKAHSTLTKKKTKTDEDHESIARSEWMGGLYWDQEIGIHLPTRCIRKSLIEGARFHKLGKQIERAVLFLDEKVRLHYDGPNDPTKLFDQGIFVDRRSVVINRKRVMRTRPRFSQWSVEGGFMLDEAQLSQSDLIRAMEHAGRYCGVGDYRPMFGRYSVEVTL